MEGDIELLQACEAHVFAHPGAEILYRFRKTLTFMYVYFMDTAKFC